MAIDFYLTATPDLSAVGALEPALTLGDDMLDGIVRCIQAFTGNASVGAPPTIDMYGHAVFSVSQLPNLLRALDRATTHYQTFPESFSVPIATEVLPQHRECFQTVSRERLLAALQSLQSLVTEAVATRVSLIACGE